VLSEVFRSKLTCRAARQNVIKKQKYSRGSNNN